MSVLTAETYTLDAARIRTLRKRRKLTMEAAAALAGFSGRAAWYNVESGRSPRPMLGTVVKFAKALGVAPQSLLKKEAK